jgi:hypothetical protein
MVIDTNVLLYYLDGRAPVVQLLDRLDRLKLPDAVIAATALEAGETLMTHDRRGFSEVAGLRVLDPLPPADADPGPSTVREPRVRYRPSTGSGRVLVRTHKAPAKSVRSGPVRKRTT